jgi:hypothetical protein
MENKLPTAEEILFDECTKNEHEILSKNSLFHEHIVDAMIEFAKLHVQKALKAASEKAEMNLIKYTDDYEIDRHSILNAYNLDEII